MGEKREGLRRIRVALAVFLAGLVLSGVTAFPLLPEVEWLARLTGVDGVIGGWIGTVRDALRATQSRYPFLFYGTDWLAFGHLVIALFFLPLWREPVRYRANVDIGLVACLGVFPLALICGPLRGIPFWWQLLDCGFGVFGGAALLWLRREIERLKDDSRA